MRIEDLLFAVLPCGSFEAPSEVDSFRGELLDPLTNPLAFEELFLVAAFHDPGRGVAAILVEKPAGGVSGGWNTGILVFRDVCLFECRGSLEGLVGSSPHPYFSLGEAPIVPTENGFMLRLFDFPSSSGHVRVGFLSAVFYGGIVPWVGQFLPINGRSVEIFAPWRIDWHSQIEVTVMSTLSPTPQMCRPEQAGGFATDQVNIPEQGVVPGEGVSWFRVVGGVGRVGRFLWRVLAVEDSKVLLVTEHVVAVRRFDALSNDWVASELRDWMHCHLLDQLGDTVGASIIPTVNVEGEAADLVFLLSVDEAGHFFSGDADRATTYRGYPFWWWLRSPGTISPATESPYCPYVSMGGLIDPYGNIVDREYIGVRPAMWLSTDYWGS